MSPSRPTLPPCAASESGAACRLEAAQAIAKEAGLLARRFLLDPASLGVTAKGPQDFVTAADKAVEQLIADRIAETFPADGFLGEEAASNRRHDARWLWVVDPIDGTTNFIQGRPDWCVSIGLLLQGRPEVGVIYHPAQDELFAGRRGQGATCNGVAITVSRRPSLATAVVALENSPSTALPEYLGHIRAVLEQGSEYRRNGSAALSLAYVAAGRFDGFVEMDLRPWDVIAGIVLVNEAGGWTNDFLKDDGLRRGNRMIAIQPTIRDALVAALRLPI